MTADERNCIRLLIDRAARQRATREERVDRANAQRRGYCSACGTEAQNCTDGCRTCWNRRRNRRHKAATGRWRG